MTSNFGIVVMKLRCELLVKVGRVCVSLFFILRLVYDDVCLAPGFKEILYSLLILSQREIYKHHKGYLSKFVIVFLLGLEILRIYLFLHLLIHIMLLIGRCSNY